MYSPLLVPEIATDVQPWVADPYRLLSWWDMEIFSAAAFQRITSGLLYLLGKIEELPPDAEGGDLAAKYLPAVRAVRGECEKLDLQVSMRCCNDFISKADGMTLGELTRSLHELNNTIHREMQSYSFFHMPFTQAKYYKKNMLLGARVAIRFPTTEFDVIEAGNCYAMGRATACVFHLMRVMEVGVQTFGEVLGVQLAVDKNWQCILDEVNKAIKRLPPKDSATVELSQVAAHLYNVKIAWRNQVMHPHDKYTMDEAKDLLGHVESFMKTLAEFVPVPKQPPPVLM